MKILILSDVESKYLWDYFEKEKLEGIDLILSCGDLKPQYLSFLASFTKAPVLYVRGNHDDCYEIDPPDGCICIEDSIYNFNGLRIMGLGGSIKYNNGKNQYTQNQMKKRVKRMWFKLMRNHGFDILLTHAPAAGFHEGDDRAHKGFDIFSELIDRYHPKFFIHGHVHKDYSRNFVRQDQIGDTTVINGYERFTLEI
ncbi:MAG: metallophosphoesterase family protein [Lachnospira sp.]|mgnify:CR=1 FL=1|nr:metallophosphoesterase family protein [Lachnospira sp.]